MNTRSSDENRGPRLTLEYDLHEDMDDILMALNAAKYKCALLDFDNYLRKRIKYEEVNDELYEELEKIRDALHDLCADNDVFV